MKKKYIKPQMEIMDMELGQNLLAASCESDDFWKCPEPQEGCDNPYWCGDN